MMRGWAPRWFSALGVFVLLFSSLVVPSGAQEASPAAATPQAVTSRATSSTDPISPVDLDVLFIGAHPDDEAFGLPVYGQWAEYADIETGVITVTRGEGGGNAVGPEEGPALGLLREDEERRAVSVAGIEHIYNLDKVDFYYTVSAPLTIETWDYEDTLSRVVRVIRTTQPEVIITMNPAPTPGNHGHHQVAARLAVDAFEAAADPERFPEQITNEGLAPWSASAIYQSGAAVESAPGPDCATTFTAADPSQSIYGVWQGTISDANDGRTWGEVARDGQRTYASQGWAVFPDASSNPDEIGCNYFTLIDSRVPRSPDPASTTAMLDYAVLEVDGGLPLGTQLIVEADRFAVAAGETFTVSVSVSLPDDVAAAAVTLRPADIEGWDIQSVEQVEADGVLTQTFEIRVPIDAPAGLRQPIDVQAAFGGGSATARTAVEVTAPVTGSLKPLPEIAQFHEWAAASNVPQLSSLIFPVQAIGSGQTVDLDVVVTNSSTDTQSGDVAVVLPDGFELDPPTQSFANLPAGDSTVVTFALTNTDTSLATSNQGGEGGNYPISVETTVGGVTFAEAAALNLVPVAVVPAASSNLVVDGVIAEGEYAGEPLDLSRLWEGQEVDGPEDASGTAWVAWSEDGLYVAVEVVDESLGTVLTPEDAKRHWRTDSVEIAVDPLGTAPNTSATFKVGVFPTTTDGSPAAYRDADAHQGPVSETAPGFEVASVVSEPYTGYVLETFIPFDALPAEIDPDHAALNIFIYDSDTQDLTGQSRLGWSTWNGVQGDPYRWGRIVLEGFGGDGATPVAAASPVAEPAVEAPVMPLDAAQSAQSPQSIAQSAADGVPLAGSPAVVTEGGFVFTRQPTLVGDTIYISAEATASGVARFYIVNDEWDILSEGELDVDSGALEFQAGGIVVDGPTRLLVSFVADDGRVQAFEFPLGAV